jgi:hypothetical protein
MDAEVMELRLKKWIPIFEEQAKSGLGKNEWCEQNGIRKWEFYERQRECRKYLLKRDLDPGITSGTAAIAPSFVEIPADPAPGISATYGSENKDPSGHIDVTCGKFKISITGTVNEGMLARLIREVSHA